MLVLTRKVGEAIRISSDITVVVAKIGRERVRLGIQAPRSEQIVRTEQFATKNRNGTGTASRYR